MATSEWAKIGNGMKRQRVSHGPKCLRNFRRSRKAVYNVNTHAQHVTISTHTFHIRLKQKVMPSSLRVLSRTCHPEIIQLWTELCQEHTTQRLSNYELSYVKNIQPNCGQRVKKSTGSAHGDTCGCFQNWHRYHRINITQL